MPNVQNNFNSMNKGNFSDKQIDNTPPANPMDTVLDKFINQNDTAIRSTGNFNSKIVTQ